MRDVMIEQSRINTNNISGTSVGFKGDGIKLGGGRQKLSNPGPPSPLGGNQGGQGMIFGEDYQPGSIGDHVVEAFAGPHDYLNSWFWYNDEGNIRNDVSNIGRIFGQGLNYINVPLSAPLVIFSLLPTNRSTDNRINQ